MASVAETSLIANQVVAAARVAKAFEIGNQGPASGTPATIAFHRNALQFHFVDSPHRLTRREATRLLGGTAAALCFSRKMANAHRPSDDPITRPIPSSGEKLPVIGLGTWQTFDVDPAQFAPLAEVLSTFVKLSGRVIDSSPMYGRAEQVIGDLLTNLKLRDSLFLATKVWTRGQQAGIDSMERSFAPAANEDD